MTWIIFAAQQLRCAQFLFWVCYDVNPSECDDTPEIGSIFITMDLVFVDDTERSLVMLVDGINLVSCYGTVKEKCVVVIDITDGDCVG